MTSAPEGETVAEQGARRLRHRRGSSGDLFGRGMLYVLIWSMQMIVATVVSPFLVRLMSVPDFGSLAASIALYQLLLIVIVFGLDHALEMQRVEDLHDDRGARTLVAAGIVASLVVTGLAASTSAGWGPVLGFSSHTLVLLTMAWTAPGASVLLALSLLQAEDRLLRFSVVSLVSTVGGQLIGITLLLTHARSPETYLLGNVIAQWTALALGCFWTRPRLRGLFDRVLVGRALRLGVPLVLMNLSEYALTAGDRFVIQRVLGQAQVARYQVAFTVGNAVALVLTFTNRSWLPRLKSIVDPAQRMQVIAASRDGMFVLTGWAALGITIAAPALLRVFAPSSYDLGPLVLVVALVVLGALPVAAAVASSQQLVTTRWSVPLAWGAAAAVVVKVVVTGGLLQLWGINAAALGTLAALLAQAVVLRLAVSRRHVVTRSRPKVLAFIGVVVVGCLGSVLLPQTMSWNVLRFAVAVGCLAPFALALRRLQRGLDDA